MIYSLSGVLESSRSGWVIISVGGVGYKVFTPQGHKLPHYGSKLKLFTYLYIREDTAELYGFLSEEELRFFEVLVSVSGVGPKSALNLLSLAAPEKLVAAIKSGNSNLLERSAGIGRRTAERLVVELKDKVKLFKEGNVETMAADEDIIEALSAMGYSRKQSKEVLLKIDPKLIGLGERLKDALKKIR